MRQKTALAFIGLTGILCLALAVFLPELHKNQSAQAAPQAATAVLLASEFEVGECSARVFAALVNDPDIRLEVARAEKHYALKFADPEGRAKLDLANRAVAYCLALEEALASGGPADGME